LDFGAASLYEFIAYDTYLFEVNLYMLSYFKKVGGFGALLLLFKSSF